MNSYRSLGKYWAFWGLCLGLIYISIYCVISSKNNDFSSNIKLIGFSFPSDAQSIRLAAYEDTYSSFSETMGGIYLFPTSFAYGRFKHEY